MKKTLSFKENLLVGSLLFGLFFGAGNLIFPVEIGQGAGSNIYPVILGFLISGVGLPVLGVVSQGLAGSSSLYETAEPCGRPFALVVTCLLYLTIGPFFAIPRTATVAFEVCSGAFKDGLGPIWLLAFSLVFFGLALFFALRPGKIMDYIGKYMTPIFLGLLAIIFVFAIMKPMGPIGHGPTDDKYMTLPLLRGFVDGYSTMDALASLAFGVIISTNIRSLGIKDSKSVAMETLKSGLVCIVLMGLVYLFLGLIGSSSVDLIGIQENGGQTFARVAGHYLGAYGQVLLALIFITACLKTAIGLITACSQTFEALFPNSLRYRNYAIAFTLVSFSIANLGLAKIISLSIPVLMLLYPIVIVLILLACLYPWIGKDSLVYKFTMVPTIFAGLLDFLNALPFGLNETKAVDAILSIPRVHLFGFNEGFGWIVPALIGLLLGLIARRIKKKH